MEKGKRRLRVLMAVYAVMYSLFGVVLIVYPDGVARLINSITDTLGLGPPLDYGAYPFWATVSVSLLFLVAALSYLGYREVDANRRLIWLMVFAKYVSAVCQVGYFIFSADHPPGFVVGGLVDWFLGTVATVFLVKAETADGEESG